MNKRLKYKRIKISLINLISFSDQLLIVIGEREIKGQRIFVDTQ